MPRPAKGVRLWLRKGKRGRAPAWVIRNGKYWESTGFGEDHRGAAEEALANYILERRTAPRDRDRASDEIAIADVIAIYLTDKAPDHARPQETAQRAGALLDWWGDKSLSDVTGANCRAYVKSREGQSWKSARKVAKLVSSAAPRRELEDLRAAINYHRKEGLCRHVVEVTLPEKPRPREGWLTRSEVAKHIWAAWRARDKLTGRWTARHTARYILSSLYTGTRTAAVCGAAIRPTIGRAYVDLERGVFHRKPSRARETKKRRPPARISGRLLAHMRRWERLGISVNYVVEWNGKPVTSIRKGFATARKAAGLGPDITPHTYRHTAATWLMQAGAEIWDAAGLLGMTTEQLERTYGHHHPDFQRDAAEKLSGATKRQ